MKPGFLSRDRAPDAPRWDLLLVLVGGMVVSYVWRFHDLFPALRPFKLLLVSSVLASAVWMAGPDRIRRLHHLKSPPATWLMWLVAIMVLGIPTSVYQGGSFWFIFFDFSKTLLFAVLVAACIRSFRDVERVVLVFLVGGILHAGKALIRGAGASGRLGGVVSYDANDVSALCVIMLPFAVYFLARRGSTFMRGVGLAALLVAVVTIVQSVSRGAFIGLVVTTLFVLLRYDTIRARSRMIAAGLAAATLLLLASGPYWAQVSTIFSPSQDYNVQDEASGRFGIWKRGMGYMLRRPVLGVGVRQFPTAEGLLSELGQSRADAAVGFKWSVAHNSFVEVGAELGLTGLVVFLGMLISTVNEMTRVRGSPSVGANAAAMSHALTGAVLAYCVTGFFLSHAYYAHLYFLIALGIGFGKLYPRVRRAPRAAGSQRPLRPPYPQQLSPAPR